MQILDTIFFCFSFDIYRYFGKKLNSMFSESFNIVVPPEKSGMRLDQWLSEELSEKYSRSQISKWIKSGFIVGPDSLIKGSRKIEPEEMYTVQIPEPVLHKIEPIDLSLEILYEDDNLAVIKKPPGIPVHPGSGESSKITLLNGIYHVWNHLKPTPENFRPGIVHRLDMHTEGILIIALNSNALRRLSEQFQKRTVKKEYTAWLMAAPPETEARLELPLKRHPAERMKMMVHKDGRSAVTSYKFNKAVISKKGRKYASVDIQIETGRTHQIRVHMAYLGCPVVGDNLYSRSYREFEKYGLLLLARKIQFIHPVTSKHMEFEISLPERFIDFEKHCEAL